MSSQIERALVKLFDRHRIVFWYDAKQALRDDFEALSNGNPLFHESRPEPVGILSAICQQHCL